jgi:two-component system, chemotaxis family, protein-glutamate methylesterase/glutaminase
VRTDSTDVVALDVELPPTNCLELLQAMRQEGMRAAAILVGESNDRSRDLIARAVELGALDFVQRTECADEEESLRALGRRLVPLGAAAIRRKDVQTILRGAPPSKLAAAPIPVAPGAVRMSVGERSTNDCLVEPRGRVKPAMVLIGASTGGPEALARVIPALLANLRVPVLIAQHLPPHFTQNLAEKLNDSSAWA